MELEFYKIYDYRENPNLIIDETSVYELDQNCLKQKSNQKYVREDDLDHQSELK